MRVGSEAIEREWQFEGGTGSTWGAAAGEVVNESEGGSGWDGKDMQGRAGEGRGEGVCLCRGTSVHTSSMREGMQGTHTMQQCARSVLEWKPVLRGLTSRSTLSPSQTATRWPLCESTEGPTGQVWGLQAAAVTRHRRHLKDAHDNGILGACGKQIGGGGGGCCLGAERALSVLIWRYEGMERYAIRFRTYPWWEEDVDVGVVFSCCGSLKSSRLIEGKISATRRLGGSRRRLSNWAWVVPCGVVWWGMSQQQVRSRQGLHAAFAGRARESV